MLKLLKLAALVGFLLVFLTSLFIGVLTGAEERFSGEPCKIRSYASYNPGYQLGCRSAAFLFKERF
jgi:hypothetical protein